MKTLHEPKTKTEIIRRIQALQPDSSRRWGKMRVDQMLCHLTDQLRIATGNKPPYPVDDLLKRTLVKWLVFYVVGFPRGAPTLMEMDQSHLGTQPSDFEADRQALLDQIETFTQRQEAFVLHPYFGHLSKKRVEPGSLFTP